MLSNDGINYYEGYKKFFNNSPYSGKPENPLMSKISNEFLREKKINYNSERKNKWALNMDKSCPDENNLPFVQPYKEYNNFFDRSRQSQEQVNKYKNSFLDNDNISIRHFIKSDKKAFALKKISTDNDDLHNLKRTFLAKSLFGPHHETINYSWIPQKGTTINNRSSVNYNIISPKENKDDEFWSKKIELSLMNKKINNRQKNIAEFSDLTAPFGLRINREFENQYNYNPDIFKNYMGIFSHMYQMSQRNGNLSVPFRKSSELAIGKDHSNNEPKKIKYISRRNKISEMQSKPYDSKS